MGPRSHASLRRSIPTSRAQVLLSLSDEDLDREIKRAASVTKIAQTIINNGNLALSAMNAANEYGFNAKNPEKNIPKMLEVGER